MITTPKPCNLAEREHYNSKVIICVKLRTQWNLLWCPHHQAAAVCDNEKSDSHLKASIKYTWSRSDGGFWRVAACYKDTPLGSSAAFDHISSHLIAARFKIKPCISSPPPIQTSLTGSWGVLNSEHTVPPGDTVITQGKHASGVTIIYMCR